jgi:16S rRNA (uracil1498-N3)-methyltransferase
MHRLYCPSKNISSDKIIIEEREQIHHAKDVLRLRINEEVTIFDDKGNEYRSILENALPRSLTFKIKERYKINSHPAKIKITVACAIPKAGRMDEIIDKLTQLGVDRIIPLQTERVIVKLDKHKKLLRQERWKKIALNASLQSQRNTIPLIEPIKDIRQVLSTAEDFDLKLIPTLTGERKSLKDILEKSKPKNILVLIGPEGDFTEKELELAKSRGCISVSLGDLVLRIETAAVVTVSFIRLYAES